MTHPATIHVHANGLDFACLEWGHGPLVLLIHGFPDTARTWDLVGPRLAEAGYRVVAPYTRGIAPTAVPADGRYDADSLGSDVLGLIEALGERQAVIIGHDFGATAVYAAAGLSTGSVVGMATLAIPHPATIQPTPGLLWKARHFVTMRLPGAARRFAANDFAGIRVLYERWSPTAVWSEEEFASAKTSYRTPGSLEAAIGYYAFVTAPSKGIEATIDVPALVIGGADDGVATAANFEGSTKAFSGPVRVEMLPGGHFLHREQPSPVIEALLGFLKEITWKP